MIKALNAIRKLGMVINTIGDKFERLLSVDPVASALGSSAGGFSVGEEGVFSPSFPSEKACPSLSGCSVPVVGSAPSVKDVLSLEPSSE